MGGIGGNGGSGGGGGGGGDGGSSSPTSLCTTASASSESGTSSFWIGTGLSVTLFAHSAKPPVDIAPLPGGMPPITIVDDDAAETASWKSSFAVWAFLLVFSVDSDLSEPTFMPTPCIPPPNDVSDWIFSPAAVATWTPAFFALFTAVFLTYLEKIILPPSTSWST